MSLRLVLAGLTVGLCLSCVSGWAQAPSPVVPPADVLRQLNDRYKELTESPDPSQPPIIAGGVGVTTPAEQLQIIVSQIRIKHTQLQRKAAAAQQDEQNVAVLIEQNRGLGATLREQQQTILGLQEQLKAAQSKGDGSTAGASSVVPELPKEPTQP
jgi:hypothetical protein